MTLLLAALLAALAVVLLAFAGRPPLDRFAPGLVRGAGVALVAALPLLYAWAVLAGASPRLGAVRVDYVGKQLAFSPELPATIGGSDRTAGDVEDLHATRLPAAALAVRPGEDGGLELALGSPAPAVEVGGAMLNEVPLAEGDVVEIAGAGPDGQPLRLTFTGGGLSLGEAEAELPNRLLLRLRGDDRVVFLRDLLPELAPDATAQPWSFLRLPGMASRWRLVLREGDVRVVKAEGEAEEPAAEESAAAAEAGAAETAGPGGEADSAVRGLDDVPAGAFQPRFRVPSPARLRLGVVWGQPGRRVLSWARHDLLTRREGVLEARFAEPLRYLAEIDPQAPRGEGRRLAIVVPGTFDRHEMIELDEPSARFRGLSALLELPAGGGAELAFLGARRPLAFGEVYALGEGDDLVFLRFDREEMPWPLLLDLALLGLFLAVFLGPSLAAEPGLAAVAGPVGLLLANRLLFAWKAAHRPPAYAVEALAEA
ncbi:MAG TPA: hypothetical protein VHM02_05750, partial [Thermoanaerobaculia bacterium]|nr:hypothetical protein [Thermoanaerobaculia bacterium]